MKGDGFPREGLHLEDVGLCAGGRVVFHGLDVELPERGLIALVGPPGAGKSALCELLARSTTAAGARRWGRLSQDGTDWRLLPPAALVTGQVSPPAGTVLSYLLSAAPAAVFLRLTEQPEEGPRWAKLLMLGLGVERLALEAPCASLSAGQMRQLALIHASATDAPLICADRVTEGLTGADQERVLRLLRAIGQTRPVLFVPSCLDEVRGLPEELLLLAGGCIRERTTCEAFLAGPATPWGQRLVETGGCAGLIDERPPPAGLLAGDAPGIQWILPGLLAGMSRPGLVRDLETDLASLRRLGIHTVVTLEEKHENAEALARAGFQAIHFPIRDMHAPDAAEALRMGERLCALMAEGKGVVLHCKGGQGRTGTMLAVCLMLRGHRARQAIELLRQLHPRYVETQEQLDFLAGLDPRPPLRATTGFGLDRAEPTDDTIDRYPFGVVRLDEAGRVLQYNLYEERLARRSRNEVIGKNFFQEVAPCTQVKRFYGRFLDGVARRSLDASFHFIFPFAHGERRVHIAMFHRADDDSFWVLVRG